MGTWNDSILGDDDASDVYETYRRLYNEGAEHSSARHKLEHEWAVMVNDSDCGPIFWLAIAKAQWEFGALEPEVLARVTEIADQGLGLDRWEEQGPRAADKRRKVITDFLAKIRQPNPKPKKRRVERKYPPIYQPGDCLAFPLSDGTFGAVMVLAIDNSHDPDGIDYVGLLDFRSVDKPSLEVFQTGSWIQLRDGPFLPSTTPFLMCMARTYRKEGKGIERIGQVPLRKDVPRYTGTGSIGGWYSVRVDLDNYFDIQCFEDTEARGAYFKLRYYSLITGPGKYDEHEPILLESYELLKSRASGVAAADRGRILNESLKRLVKFYSDWNKPDEAQRWQAELDLLPR